MSGADPELWLASGFWSRIIFGRCAAYYAATDKVEKRFDLSESDAVPGTYPVAVAVSKDGTRGFVALWNASEVVELDLVNGKVGRRLALLKPSDPVKPGTHPCAMVISPDGKTLYVALANRDAVAAVDIGGGNPTHRDETAMNGAPSSSMSPSSSKSPTHRGLR